MNKIVLLMGVSSSGKSSVAHALQQLDTTYEIMGFDTAVEKHLDKKYWPGGSHDKEGFYYQEVQTADGAIPKLHHGKEGERFLKLMLQEIIDAIDAGKNIIIDSVLSDEELQTIVEHCQSSKLVQVALKPPLEEVIRREQARGDRQLGLAKSTYAEFYAGKHFDLVLDTSVTSPEDAAGEIERFCTKLITNTVTPRGF